MLPSEIPLKRHMKTFLKTVLIAAAGLLTLAVILAAAALRFLFPGEGGGTSAYRGSAATDRLPCLLLPPPEQVDEGFPIVAESVGMFDYSGFIIFRAADSWQQAFRQSCATGVNDATGGDFLFFARNKAEAAQDEALLTFLCEREWAPFHSGCVQHDGWQYHFNALRDATGEHLLIYYHSPLRLK